MTDAATQLAAPPANGPSTFSSSTSKSIDSMSPESAVQPTSSIGRSPKKRRKVNHACVYCRRSHMTCDEERPCGRCLKRNIGHLCHDEPREIKKPKQNDVQTNDHEHDEATVSIPSTAPAPSIHSIASIIEPQAPQAPAPQVKQTTQAPLAPPPMPPPRASAPTIIAPLPVSATSRPNMESNGQAFLGLTDWDFLQNTQSTWLANPYHQQWMFNANEAADEFSSMSDWVGNFHGDSNFFNDGSFFGGLNNLLQSGQTETNESHSMGKPTGPRTTTEKMPVQHERPLPAPPQPIQRPDSVMSTEKARDNYYLTAADPTKDAPEERMKQILRAKYQAGLLKPFNYVKGYARLAKFMERNYAPTSQLRIARQLDKFRPKFREKMQRLTDLDLVSVEEWFEKTLMEYDRVFASMAVPACLWRRTGEIFRGNKEFADLIKVPIEHMRDGKLAIYELISEESFFCYWDKFGSIAFDVTQKAMLTTCQLRNPDPNAPNKFIDCCFSFTIRRDVYDIPCAIVGNFIPIL
ncbi:hypothetical protein DFH27DRAFT_485733 [Peziza echinospora]|nr:hypothetical protein DFH27DRAFT_485733 [Peziza echinospora]